MRFLFEFDGFFFFPQTVRIKSRKIIDWFMYLMPFMPSPLQKKNVSENGYCQCILLLFNAKPIIIALSV